VPKHQLTTKPSKQSITGDRYTLLVGNRNSVISVSHFFQRFGVEVSIDVVRDINQQRLVFGTDRYGYALISASGSCTCLNLIGRRRQRQPAYTRP